MTTFRSRHARPARPYFSSGPCAKPPGWAPEQLALGSLGRSHRSKLGKARLGHAIELTRQVLRVPAEPPHRHRPRLRHRRGRDGAVDAARRPAGDPARLGELRRRLGDRRGQAAEARRDGGQARPMAQLPDLAAVDPASDVVFTWNGTTSGVRVPDGDWIADDREGLTICDATSAAFAHGPALGQARCRHLQLAEGAGRRGRPRHADPRPARGRAAGKPRARLAAAQDLPADQGRQADRGHLQGRDDQHAVDARGRGLYLRARMGASCRAGSTR